MNSTMHINRNFSAYLNRHLSGIIHLKDKLKKVAVLYNLAESFSSYTCRFYIEVEFIDYDALTEKEQQYTTAFLYNNGYTGYQFVSFCYKEGRSGPIHVEEVESFIFHYKLAQNLFEEVIKGILPDKCLLEIANLDAEPFFSYTSDFLASHRYVSNDNSRFENDYLRLVKRDFEFDCEYHNSLMF